MDLTIAEFAAQLPAGDLVRRWWETAAALPADVTMNEFFAKTLKATSDAQRTKNGNLAAGSRIDGYPSPTNEPVTIDAATGMQSFVATYSVRSRVAVNLDVAISPLA
ncbi:MAG: hypothetical protein KME60_07090 [Cyanomargarita calcarea GSE-NOS-MK-12-04C]|jgi:hypothetical protein|uniref:Uncharacterized protein n=1 Tax=Cyanomargarita calcarea GSE-NOS-MK-12-04C TaxID=2839659 RepID=A0A951URV1_9CYAN|nr:hypothetical protein [Cyanomargarita calcarea GSE-NOS-MK-12-04C]